VYKHARRDGWLLDAIALRRPRLQDLHALVSISGCDWADERALPCFIGHYSRSPSAPSATSMRCTGPATQYAGRAAIVLKQSALCFDHYETKVDVVYVGAIEG